jgi:hypothetical protein
MSNVKRAVLVSSALDRRGGSSKDDDGNFDDDNDDVGPTYRLRFVSPKRA